MTIDHIYERCSGKWRNPGSKHEIQPAWRMSGLAPDGTAKPFSLDLILRRERRRGKNNFPVQLAMTENGNHHTLLIRTLLKVLASP